MEILTSAFDIDKLRDMVGSYLESGTLPKDAALMPRRSKGG